MKGIIVGRTNAKIVDVPDNANCEWYATQIGCEWIEIVRPAKLPRGYVMIVDEEGLLKPNFINLTGSWLYGTETHGNPIMGNILIVREENCDLRGLTDDEVEVILCLIAPVTI